jgi:hypothetical protein
MCYARLNDDLTAITGEVTTMFAASETGCSDPHTESDVFEGVHYVTDGPFAYRSRDGELFLLWSTFIDDKYAECLLKFQGGEIGMDFTHLTPLLDNDGGHGMIFSDGKQTYLTYHTPNTKGKEHPTFRTLEDCGYGLELKD